MPETNSTATETTATRGPWKPLNHCRKTSNFDPSYRETILGRSVDGHADTVATVHGVTREETMANARLIAAAPDLLEALKNTASALACAIRANLSRDLYDSDDDYNAAIRNHGSIAEANAAIAKAEGGS